MDPASGHEGASLLRSCMGMYIHSGTHTTKHIRKSAETNKSYKQQQQTNQTPTKAGMGCMPVITTLGKLRPEDHEFFYYMMRLGLKERERSIDRSPPNTN